MAKQLQITISAMGVVEIEAVGFQGQGCLEASRPFEQAFGGVGTRTEKPELRQRGSSQIVETEGQKVQG